MLGSVLMINVLKNLWARYAFTFPRMQRHVRYLLYDLHLAVLDNPATSCKEGCGHWYCKFLRQHGIFVRQLLLA